MVKPFTGLERKKIKMEDDNMGYMETYKAWCDNEYFDEATREELKSIAGN